VHPAVIGSPQKFYSILFADPLDRESAKTILVDCFPSLPLKFLSVPFHFLAIFKMDVFILPHQKYNRKEFWL